MAGWHDGLAFEIWLALAAAFCIAFALELRQQAREQAFSSVVGPTQGMILSEAIYRIAGSLFGAVAIILTSLVSQDRTMLIAVFSVYMACLVAIATLLRLPGVWMYSGRLYCRAYFDCRRRSSGSNLYSYA